MTGAQTTTVTNTSEEEEQPILLLPPSTTQYDIFPSDDNMEVDSNKGSNISAVATPSFAGRKRLASGLGNLGNTCFMNSTLQCLAHTEPLRRYFLSGDYEADLNRDNPLGTGGELASQFASLISEMWGIATKRRNVLGAAETSSYSHSSSSAVYPRSFKYCLGKHAEQFMGYDQHDSQELATYLLDALHEDTNRVTKKPYVEKPEQGEDEPDELASNKAWGLHLQREDSRVLENFMGQVKSRLECCEPDCNRVSTTFDPFMYLSVPIPGASDRTLKLTFIPLDPNQKMKNLQLTISKTATMSKLMEKMNEELIRLGICNEPIPTHDLCPVDVWSHEVFSWYSDDSEIDRIRDSDTTYIFQLRPLSEVQEVGKNDEESDNFDNKFGESRTKHRYQLDLGTMTKLNLNDEWMKELEKYVHQPTLLYSMFNPNRGTIDERMQFHKKMENFIDVCHKEITEEEPSGLKRTREESDADSKSETPSEEAIQGLQDRCDASKTFENVKTRQDVAVLEFIANKIRQFILRLVHEKKNKFKDGIMIQIIMRRPQNGTHSSTKDSTFAPPLVLRIAPNMTVYGLREELATRFSRSLSLTPMNDTPGSGESSAEGGDKGNRKPVDETFGSPELLIMRQIPLTFERKSTYSNKSSLGSNKKLGMLEKAGNQTQEESRQAVLAVSSDESEQALLLDIVGHKGTVNMDWPTELCNRSFDLNEYETADDASTRAPSPEAQKVTTVLDCIEKYCQKEQLEETEMWYCNRCKKHVRAWKQFHLYRAPPILIVHLKRFHYSATTHRRDKITAFIDFELEGLDLSELFTHYSEEEKPIYDCYAVSNHYGGLGGGHYTAYTLSDDGTWCHYDDSRVTNSIDVKEVVSEAAYVLYYRRRDVPVGEDFIENSVPSSPMVCEEEDAPMMQGRGSSEVSSNNTAQAGDDDRNDDLTMDEVDEGSGGTCSSRVASLDGDTANEPPGDIVTFGTDVDFPLQ